MSLGLLSCGAEDVPAATTVTNGNSGGTFDNALTNILFQSTSTIQSSTAVTPAHGKQHFIVNPLNGSVTYIGWNGYSSNKLSLSFYIYLTANPSADTTYLTIRTGAAKIAGLAIRSTGKLRLANNAAATQDSTTSISLNQWVRIDAVLQVGTTTSNGVWKVKLFNTYDSNTADEEINFNAGATNTGTVNLTEFRLGKAESSTTTVSFYLDELRADDTTTSYLGPTSRTWTQSLSYSVTDSASRKLNVLIPRQLTQTQTPSRVLTAGLPRAYAQAQSYTPVKQAALPRSYGVTTALSILKTAGRIFSATVSQALTRGPTTVGINRAYSLTPALTLGPRTVSAIRTFTSTLGYSVTKLLPRTLTYTAAYTPTLTKQPGKPFAYSASQALTRQLGVGLVRSATSSTAVAVVKGVSRLIAASSTLTASLTRSIRPTLAFTASTGASLALANVRVFAYTVGSGVARSLTAGITRASSASTGATVTRAVSAFKSFTATASASISLPRTVVKALGYLGNSAVSAVKAISQAQDFTVSVSPSHVLTVGLHRLASTSSSLAIVIGNGFTRAFSYTVSTAADIVAGRAFLQVLNYAASTAGYITRAVALSRSMNTRPDPGLQRTVGLLRSAGTTTLGTLQKSVSVRFRALSGVTADFSRVAFHGRLFGYYVTGTSTVSKIVNLEFFGYSIAVIAGVGKAVTKRPFAYATATTAALVRSIPRVFLAQLAPGVQLTRSITQGFSFALTASQGALKRVSLGRSAAVGSSASSTRSTGRVLAFTQGTTTALRRGVGLTRRAGVSAVNRLTRAITRRSWRRIEGESAAEGRDTKPQIKTWEGR